MTANAREVERFNKELDKVVQKLIPEEVRLVVQKLALEALTRLVQKTPVNTGRARNGWTVTFSRPSEANRGAPSPGQVGEGIEETTLAQKVISRESSKIALDKNPFTQAFISNNVDYIVDLDGGSSDQNKDGMTGPTIRELNQMFP